MKIVMKLWWTILSEGLCGNTVFSRMLVLEDDTLEIFSQISISYLKCIFFRFNEVFGFTSTASSNVFKKKTSDYNRGNKNRYLEWCCRDMLLVLIPCEFLLSIVAAVKEKLFVVECTFISAIKANITLLVTS